MLHGSRIKVTQQLHVLQAHLLHYQSLLHHFRKSVNFIEQTPNPAMESESFTNEQRKTSYELMGKECKNLLSEIARLQMRREMLSSRLKNAMDLAFATVNIEDSSQTRRLTEATIRDSAAMRQVCPSRSRQIIAPGTDRLLVDLVLDNGFLTGKFHSGKMKSSTRTYLTHISLDCF